MFHEHLSSTSWVIIAAIVIESKAFLMSTKISPNFLFWTRAFWIIVRMPRIICSVDGGGEFVDSVEKENRVVNCRVCFWTFSFGDTNYFWVHPSPGTGEVPLQQSLNILSKCLLRVQSLRFSSPDCIQFSPGLLFTFRLVTAMVFMELTSNLIMQPLRPKRH